MYARMYIYIHTCVCEGRCVERDMRKRDGNVEGEVCAHKEKRKGRKAEFAKNSVAVAHTRHHKHMAALAQSTSV